MKDAHREHLMLRAAELYYYERLTQAAIADRLMCSRWTVGRLLEEARDSGMISISIVHPSARDRSIELELVDAFGVGEAIVVAAQATLEATARLVASTAAGCLTGLRPRPASLGVSWGRTVAGMARAMPDRWMRDLHVYQAFGGLARSDDAAVTDSIGLLARKGQGIGHLLPAPALVGDVDLARRLLQEPTVASTLEAAARADAIIYSPGAVSRDSILVRSGYLTAQMMERLRHIGAKADILAHFVDDSGQPVSAELEERSIAIGLDALAAAKTCILLGSGAHRAEPMRVALAAGYASTVVTDAQTAAAILAR
ncbi:sugar-binding transcriptional regulator [Actinomyces slackii]|uniref:Deoxyribonucleoside regulator n=1 Tax=Actinomyces slackii TaxID=52774 RepID=A0A448K8Y8_9ACTO|nr:sugar-binding domain-containing protein [Actinomyces slackii]VEG73438.1 Deoxyribonucleoside regulator [Actinomyces slackii]